MSARDASLLGAYVLPGPETKPLPGIGQTTEAERLGLGSVWLSELQGPVKDAGAILGYMGAATSKIGVGTSITHFGTRHPMVLASWGLTMQVMTGGRFLFGFGRSTPERWRNWGVTVPTIASMEGYAGILRRLWAHERFSYDGPAGRYPKLGFDDFPDYAPPPLMLAAIGPKTLQLVGRSFDAVLLHPFLTPEAVARSRAIVHEAAEAAGRDPAAVKIYHQIVTAPDMSAAAIDKAVHARLAAYMSHPGFGEPILEVNGWDAAPLAPFRAAVAEAAKENDAAGSPLKGRDVLIKPSRLLPPEWLRDSAAIGTAAQCAARLHDFLDAGADEIIIHGVTPDGLEATVKAFVRAGTGAEPAGA
jgi:probable F420-dependent oxidoreductase